KLHLYHCDHRGLPLALISPEGETAWSAEYDEWGNLLNEDNPQSLKQLSACRGSSMMRSQDCITTVTGTMIRYREDISRRTRLGWLEDGIFINIR
ncbi:RHS repeat protein, partial [Salmonella enterica subsp. enterica]|nr:RHS repeat protein [Salmonella enterica subsp. enterica]